MSRRRQNQGYSVRENKAFKKGLHFGWNKHKKMIRNLRTCKRQLKKKPRKSKSMKLRKIYIEINRHHSILDVGINFILDF